MPDKKEPFTLDKIAEQYGKISEKSTALVGIINSNFAGLKINTAPLEKLSSVMSKMKTVLNAVGLPKYTLDTIHATTELCSGIVNL